MCCFFKVQIYVEEKEKQGAEFPHNALSLPLPSPPLPPLKEITAVQILTINIPAVDAVMDGANKCFQTLLGSNTRSAYFLPFDGMGGLRHSSKRFFFSLLVKERDLISLPTLTHPLPLPSPPSRCCALCLLY